jgi:hypothetical protein
MPVGGFENEIGRTVVHRKLITVSLTGAAVSGLLGSAASAAVPTDSTNLRNALTVENIRAHQEELQAIADANNGTRASGTPGYDASAEYVAGLLEKAGYVVTRQEFDFPFFDEVTPAVFEIEGGKT